MKLAEFGERENVVPWAAGGKIPWHEPAFSERMLRAHLSQEHDRASRRFETIDKHVAWIHQHLLGATASRVMDLGCGPGFYAARLTRLGHTCVGIDISPASIAHARSEAAREGLDCEYRLADLVAADFGADFELVLLTFGELNCFHPSVAGAILAKARGALANGGSLALEAYSEQHVRALGAQASTWFDTRESVFADQPHLCLKESTWHSETRAATERYFVLSLQSGRLDSYVSTTQGYTEEEYVALLEGAGFPEIQSYASLDGTETATDDGLFVLVAHAR